MKRSHSSAEDALPRKKRSTTHVQEMPAHTEPAPQIAEFAEGQLLRSITAALTMAGFDSVKPTALEMFRAQAEEYMVDFATQVRIAMQAQRRATPTAQDFTLALSRVPNTRTASVLRHQKKLRIPETISYPSLPLPPPAPEPAPDFTTLLQPLLRANPPRYIPSHFPQLPPEHAWTATPVFPERETDARKMREKATEEGMLAEQALRKLAAAAKAGLVKAETKKRDSIALSGIGKARSTASRKRASNDELFGDVLQDVGALDGGGDYDMGLDGTGERREKLEALQISEGLLVNHNTGYWRGGKRQGLAS